MKLQLLLVLLNLDNAYHGGRGYDAADMQTLFGRGLAAWSGDTKTHGVWQLTPKGRELAARLRAVADSPSHLEHLQDDWWVGQLPDGNWGLFEWRAAVETMEHIDTLPDRPTFGADTTPAITPPEDPARAERAYVTRIVAALCEIFGLHLDKAREAVASALETKLIAGYPMMLHETVGYWAATVYSGRRDFWRKEPVV